MADRSVHRLNDQVDLSRPSTYDDMRAGPSLTLLIVRTEIEAARSPPGVLACHERIAELMQHPGSLRPSWALSESFTSGTRAAGGIVAPAGSWGLTAPLPNVRPVPSPRGGRHPRGQHGSPPGNFDERENASLTAK